jgi:hypothetical protein
MIGWRFYDHFRIDQVPLPQGADLGSIPPHETPQEAVMVCKVSKYPLQPLETHGRATIMFRQKGTR